MEGIINQFMTGMTGMTGFSVKSYIGNKLNKYGYVVYPVFLHINTPISCGKSSTGNQGVGATGVLK